MKNKKEQRSKLAHLLTEYIYFNNIKDGWEALKLIDTLATEILEYLKVNKTSKKEKENGKAKNY